MIDLHLKVALYQKEIKQLESAQSQLQDQFETLRAKTETSYQTLEQIISNMSDGLLFISKKGKVTLYNEAAESMIAIARSDLLESNYWDFLPDAFFGFSLGLALKNGHPTGRIILSLSNGKEIEVAPTYIADKGLLLLLNDRTAYKKLERSVQQSDRLKELGEMAAILAHEIRNPLGGIHGFAALLKRELTTPQHQKMITSILEGSSTLNHLVTNVLDYARPLTLHFVPTDLASFIQKTCALSKVSGYPCKVDIQCSYTLSIDPEHMQRVLLNLIRNGYEAKASSITIILTKKRTIQLIDDGEGMSEEQLEKIFTPFFTTKKLGSGLGLSEAYKVMRAHGGFISIESRLGQGTRITLNYDD